MNQVLIGLFLVSSVLVSSFALLQTKAELQGLIIGQKLSLHTDKSER